MKPLQQSETRDAFRGTRLAIDSLPLPLIRCSTTLHHQHQSNMPSGQFRGQGGGGCGQSCSLVAPFRSESTVSSKEQGMMEQLPSCYKGVSIVPYILRTNV